MSENKQALKVAALKNGTVIDHIPSEKLFTVVQLLGVEPVSYTHLDVYKRQE